MLGDRWQGTAADLLDAIAQAGYEGIEITEAMIGEFRGDPNAFGHALEARRLRFAAYGVHTGDAFHDVRQRDAALTRVDEGARFAAAFPGTRLQMGSPMARNDAGTRSAQLREACAFFNEAGRIAADRGVKLHVHPNSAQCSLVTSAEDYAGLCGNTDPGTVGLCIDTGHVQRCGLDVVSLLRTHWERLVHVHLKDIDAAGRWAPLGAGICPLPAIVSVLLANEYDGWLICEEESDAAREDAASVIRANLHTVLETVAMTKERTR
jgi:sugar phosphate isomerase/epimerase